MTFVIDFTDLVRLPDPVGRTRVFRLVLTRDFYLLRRACWSRKLKPRLNRVQKQSAHSSRGVSVPQYVCRLLGWNYDSISRARPTRRSGVTDRETEGRDEDSVMTLEEVPVEEVEPEPVAAAPTVASPPVEVVEGPQPEQPSVPRTKTVSHCGIWSEYENY